MGDLSKNFSRSEFACKCGCGFDTVDAALLDLVQQVADEFCEPVIITSGCRCKAHNKKVGGSPKSQHLLGRAADIVVKNVDAAAVFDFLDSRYPAEFGLGEYEDFTHVDSRSYQARWDG